MLKVSRVDSHKWVFVYPAIYDELMDLFNLGCELYEEDRLDQAAMVFRVVLERMPDHLDALHHLAMVMLEQGLPDVARDLWEQADRIGRKVFPKSYKLGKDRLEWCWLENRPFLRCMYGLALFRYRDGNLEEALRVSLELLCLNPNDNQGARAIAQEFLLKLGRFQDAFNVANQYPNDIMPEIVYGRALALFKLGRTGKATKALLQAIGYLPLIARELLKTRHRLPKSAHVGFVTVGGENEAFYYWEKCGQLWNDDPEAMSWLRETVEEHNVKPQRQLRRKQGGSDLIDPWE